MTYICRHAIIVTGTHGNYISEAYAEAVKVFGKNRITAIIEAPINGVRTFIVTPDGSNEGWYESDNDDRLRQSFLAWLVSRKYEDGSSPLTWCHVQYGDERGDNRLLHTESGAQVQAVADHASIPVVLPEPSIKLNEVSSTNIAAVGYDAPSRTLAVRFKGGVEWRYAEVDAILWEGMQRAASLGSYFATYVKPGHAARKMP